MVGAEYDQITLSARQHGDIGSVATESDKNRIRLTTNAAYQSTAGKELAAHDGAITTESTKTGDIPLSVNKAYETTLGKESSKVARAGEVESTRSSKILLRANAAYEEREDMPDRAKSDRISLRPNAAYQTTCMEKIV